MSPEQEDIMTRALVTDCEVRAIDKEARTATFVAATERGVDTWDGKEYLRMTGAVLTRFRSNPVVLDTHNRYEAGAVIGKAVVKILGRVLEATITFAETNRAETIWQLVKTGFLKALSVGFMPDRSKALLLAEGEMDGEGVNQIVGPATIFRKWELYEISVVPVPADKDALRRSFFNERNRHESEPQSIVMGLVNIIQSLASGQNKEDKTMSEEIPKVETPPESPAEPVVKKQTAEVVEIPEERAARVAEAKRREFVALAPKECENLADQLVLEGATLEVARKRFLEVLEQRSTSVGTPEPKPVIKTGPEGKTEGVETRMADVSDDELTRAITG